MDSKKGPNYRHGGYVEYKREYNSWRAMKERCDNPKYRAFHRYGGRGITYCRRWKDFKCFLEDMGRRPEGMTLDRIDSDGNYCPENCRWADQKTQVRNSIKVKDAKVTSEQMRGAACSPAVIYKRLKKGWNLKEALETPPDSPHEVLRARALECRRQNSHLYRNCPVCGKQCRRKRDKYCCKEHYLKTRRANGWFSKEAQDVQPSKKEKSGD